MHKRYFSTDIHIRRDELSMAKKVVDESGAAEMLARWEAHDRQVLGLRGARGPWANSSQVLTLMLVLAMKNASALITDMTSVLAHGLDRSACEVLELDTSGLGAHRIYDRLYRSMRRLLAVVDPWPGYRHDCLTKAEFSAREARIDLEARQVAEARLQALCSALVIASVKQLPREVRRRFKGNIGLDATFVQAFGQRGDYKKSEYMASNVDAGWYQRKDDHYVNPEDVSSARVAGLRKLGWGWELTVAIMAPNDPERVATFPSLILGVSFSRPGIEPGEKAIEALRPAFEDGFPTRDLTGDKAYGSNPLPEKFQRPAREMGYGLIYDPRPEYVGKVFMEDGVAILEGNPYCPVIAAMPHLVSATLDYQDGSIDLETYKQRIEARSKFLLQAHTGAHADGSRRYRCPAMGPNPTASCAVKGRANPGTNGKTLMPIPRRGIPLEDLRGGVCTNERSGTQVVRGEHWDRHAMAVQYGTSEWYRRYIVPRQTIESVNRQLKSGTACKVDDADRRRVRGSAFAFLAVTMQVVALNIYKIARWMESDIKPDSRGRGPTKTRRPRRRDATFGAERRPLGRRPHASTSNVGSPSLT